VVAGSSELSPRGLFWYGWNAESPDSGKEDGTESEDANGDDDTPDGETEDSSFFIAAITSDGSSWIFGDTGNDGA
jgi:hypothetical protein